MGGRVGLELPQGLKFNIAQLWGQNLIHNSDCAPGTARDPVSKSATMYADGLHRHGRAISPTGPRSTLLRPHSPKR